MTELQNYHEEVREAILKRTGKPILNSNVDHASIITQEAFNNARSQIRILSSKLDPSCYAQPGVIGAAKTFLADPDRKAQILVESAMWDQNNNFEWNKHPLIEALKEFKERLELRLVPTEIDRTPLFTRHDLKRAQEAIIDEHKASCLLAVAPNFDFTASIAFGLNYFSTIAAGAFSRPPS